ncbi:MAG TPA: LPS assembly lipoprotein LptE [Stellaceae bacterium]|nr:LPS assembly lipoprotein LptE [Stellaceae bacterium]
MPARRIRLGLGLGVLLAFGGGLGGCGWTPLYADVETSPADADLRAIKVDPIAERIGQRLEQALRQSLNPNGIETKQRYLLRTVLQATRLDLGVLTQGLGTRGKLDVVATYTLSDMTSGARLLSAGSHTFESFDILANGYASVVAEDDARTRAVEELRQDMMAHLTVLMQRRAAEAAAKSPAAAKP